MAAERPLSESIDEFERRGFVLVEGAIPSALLERTTHAYLRALEEKVRRFRLAPVNDVGELAVRNDRVIADFRPIGGNHDVNRWNMHLPSVDPFLDPLIIANPRVVPLVHALLGGDAVLSMIVSDTPMPNSAFQNIHQDSRFLRLTVNLALIDFTIENGALEVWPGTHLPRPRDPTSFTRETYAISPGRMARLAAEIPSKRLLIKAGTFVIRDHRMMHRGTPNRSDRPRPMVSLYYRDPLHRPPHPWVADFVSRTARAARQLLRDTPSFDASALERANHVGRIVDSVVGSDRDARRPIPRELWDGLPEPARHLLRFARVGDDVGEATRALRSLRGSVSLGLTSAAMMPWVPLARAVIAQRSAARP